VGSIKPTRWPYFFTSYAHDLGEDDVHVQQFHAALAHEVQLFSGMRGDDIGFCDARLRVGDLWSPALVTALRTCQVFVALCSPTYFKRASCGKEWSIFTRRLDGLGQRGHGPASSLVPLFWVPMTMPDIAARYQHRDANLGEAYREYGLRDLIRLDDNRDHYRRFVTALAQRIVHLVGQFEIPPYPQRPEFDAIATAFAEPSTSAGRRTPHQAAPGTPHRNVKAPPDDDPPRPILNQNAR
jgi:hypothetical protein